MKQMLTNAELQQDDLCLKSNPMLSISAFGLLFLPIFAQAGEVEGFSWLKAHSGSLSNLAEPLQAAQELTQTLSLVNQSASASVDIAASLQDEQSTELLARAAILQKLRQQSPSIYFTQLKAAQNEDGGFGHLEGWQSNPLDTAFVLMALSETQFIDGLASVTEKQQWQGIRSKALDYLRSQQRADGSYQVLSLDKLYVSAYVLNALSKNVGIKPELTPNIVALVNFLERVQINPGQWSSHSQGLFLDALVSEALHPFHDASHQTIEAAFKQRVLNQQQSNGSWLSDPYTTALILRSLNTQSTVAVNPVTSGVRLQVIDSETGLPISGVSLTSSNPALSQSSGIDGQINIVSAPAGQIRFSLQRDGYAGMQFDITLRQGEQLNLGQIKLSRAINVTTAQVQGKIVDALTGAGVAGALVTVVRLDSNGQPTTPQTVLTGNDGSYQVILNQGGSFGIDIRKDGYAPVQGNGSVPNGNIAVFSPKLNTLANNVASAQGKVVDSNDQPIAGVSILEGSVIVATTDAQGLFSITNIQAGSKQWLVSKQGYLQATISAGLQAGQNLNIGTITLPAQTVSSDPNTPTETTVATGSIVVKALDSRNNEAISGISIVAELLNAQNNVIQQQSFNPTEASVNMATLTLPAGKWRITIKHPAYQSASQIFNLTASQTIDYQPKLTLNAYGITGIVVDSLSNKPIANAPVKLIHAITKSVLYTGQTDANGRFTAPSNITAQDVQLEINPALYLATTRFISRDAQPDSTLDLGEIRLRPQSADVVLPDLAITEINSTAVQTDLQALTINGSITATITNKGNTDLTASNVTLTAFEDSNFNRTLDVGELILGNAIFNDTLATKATSQINIPIQGKSQFRDAPIAVMVDSQNQVAEKDEKNNVRLSSDGIEIKPAQGTMEAKVAWQANYASDSGVVVAPLKDSNSDGIIGSGDVSSIIVYSGGMYRIINGKTGQLEFNISTGFGGQELAAIGDVDNDGLPEIVIPTSSGISIYSNLGVLKKTIAASGMSSSGWSSDAYHPILADLDQDGKTEIIQNNKVFSYDKGLLLNNLVSGQSQAIADVDGDGYLDIVGLTGATDRFGKLIYNFKNKAGSTLVLKFLAVGDVLGSSKPQIVSIYGSQVYIFDAKTGVEIASYNAPSSQGGSPVIADFNGDGIADIGLARTYNYVALRGDGSVIWSTPISDGSGGTGSTVFDFDNDGQSEAVHFDEQNLRIYDSRTGIERIKIPNSTATAHEYPVVADVDADGHADIIITSSGNGTRVISGKNKDWANTRNIWNQYSYHVTNINDDLTVPTHEVNSWEAHNTYRANLLLNQNATAASDLTTSYLRFSDSGIFSPSQLIARIGNAGGKDIVIGTPVSFYRIPPSVNGVASQPELVKTITLTNPLLAGKYQDISVDYAGDMSNFGELVVVANDAGAGIDSLTGIPLNAPNNGGVVQEYTRGNNLARLTFGSGFQSYSLDGLIDKTSYKAGDSVNIIAIPSNLGSLPSDVIVKMRIVDSAGNIVATLADQTASLAGSLIGDGSNSKILQTPWAIGQSHAGNYRVVIELVRDGWFGQETVASVERTFNVVSDASSVGLTTNAVQVDKTQYQAGDSVNITSRLQNTASNEIATARTVTLELLDPSGQIIWTQISNYDVLSPHALFDKTFSVVLSQAVAGNYIVRSTQHAPDGSQADQTVTRSFNVLSSTQTGLGIGGQIQSPSTVDSGNAIPLKWQLNNQSNIDLNAVNTRIILIDADTGSAIGTPISLGSQTLVKGASTTQQTVQWMSVGNADQRIMALLQVELDKPTTATEQDRWKTVSSTSFKVSLPPIKVSFDELQKASKPVLIYYSCHEGWWDVLSGWVMGKYDYACFDERERQVKSYLDRINVPYTMVKEPWQFRDKLHSGVYGQYWLLGAVEQLSPHTYKEIRESAYLGNNLLTDNGLISWQNSKLMALAGSRYRGRVLLSNGTITPQPASANLPALLTKPSDSNLSVTPLLTTTARKGQSFTANWPVLLEPLTDATQTSATFDAAKKLGIWVELSLDLDAKPISYFHQLRSYTAVSTAPYGRGQPVALAFDLPASLAAANAGQIPLPASVATPPQKRWDYALTELLAPRQRVERSSYVPSEPVHVPVTLENQSSQARTLQIDIELPSGARWLGRQGGTQTIPASAQTQSKISYQLTIPANSKVTEMVALRLPAQGGTSVVRTTVSGVSGIGTVTTTTQLAQQENRFLVRTLDERFNLFKQTIKSWNSSNGASWLELTKLKTDLLLLDTYYSHGHWELAILQAGHISDDLAAMRSAKDSRIGANRIELDELLRGMEISWYLQRNGQRITP